MQESALLLPESALRVDDACKAGVRGDGGGDWGQHTIALEDAGEFGVRAAGEDGLAESLAHEAGVAEDDDALAAKEDLVDGTEAAGQASEGEVEVLVEEGEEAEKGETARPGGQETDATAEESDEEEDGEEEEAEAGEEAEVGRVSGGHAVAVRDERRAVAAFIRRADKPLVRVSLRTTVGPVRPGWDVASSAYLLRLSRQLPLRPCRTCCRS